MQDSDLRGIRPGFCGQAQAVRLGPRIGIGHHAPLAAVSRSGCSQPLHVFRSKGLLQTREGVRGGQRTLYGKTSRNL
jgi:hypothetical protein